MASWALAAKQIVFSWQTSHKQQAARNCLFYTYKFSCVICNSNAKFGSISKATLTAKKIARDFNQDSQLTLSRGSKANRMNSRVLLWSVWKITLSIWLKISTQFLPFSPGKNMCLVRDIRLARRPQNTYVLPFRNFKNY